LPACPAYRQAGGRQESKNHDKQLTHIVRVSTSINLIVCPGGEFVHQSFV